MVIKNPNQLGSFIKDTRKSQGLQQRDLALISGLGTRFISDLENGKETCQLEKTLHVLHMLGIKVEVTSPQMEK